MLVLDKNEDPNNNEITLLLHGGNDIKSHCSRGDTTVLSTL